MGATRENTYEPMYRTGLMRYSEIIRQGGNGWVISQETRFPVVFRRLASGLYALTDYHFGATTQAAFKVPRGVVCLRSALWLHGLLAREPEAVDLAIGPKARIPKWREPAANFFRTSQRRLATSVMDLRTDSVLVRLFNLSRTIADCHRFRARIGPHVALGAIEAAVAQHLVSAQSLLMAARETGVYDWMAEQVLRLFPRSESLILTTRASRRTATPSRRRTAPARAATTSAAR